MEDYTAEMIKDMAFSGIAIFIQNDSDQAGFCA